MATFTLEEALQEAEAAHRRKDYPRALEFTDAVIKLRPAHAPALHLNGAAHFMAGQRDMGIDRVRAARRAAPDNMLFIRTLSDMLLLTNAAEEAMGILRGGLARQPDAADLWQRYAKACAATGEVESERAALEQAARLEAGN